MKQKTYLWIGLIILGILVISYFIKIPVESGTNFITISPLLGVLIFYKTFILVIYILIALFLVYKGLKGRVRFL